MGNPPAIPKQTECRHDAPQTPPSIWRLIRAYLKVRETGTVSDIHHWIAKHRPAYPKSRLYAKLEMLTKRNLIKSLKWGCYSITQNGREDQYKEDPRQLEIEDKIAPFVATKGSIYQPFTEDIKETATTKQEEAKPNKIIPAVIQEQPATQVALTIDTPTGPQEIILRLRIQVSLEMV